MQPLSRSQFKTSTHTVILECMYVLVFRVPGLFEPPVTVIMLSPGVSGASLLSVSIGSQHIV